MEITTEIAGRNAAVKLVQDLCFSTVNSEPFAYAVLARVRSYLRKSTEEIGKAYFA